MAKQINLTVKLKSSRSAVVQWSATYKADNIQCQITVETTDHSDHDVFNVSYENGQYEIDSIEGGNDYKVTLHVWDNSDNGSMDPLVEEGSSRFRSILMKSELEELQKRSLDFIKGTSPAKIEVLYRNKPKDYWLSMREVDNGVMLPYTKDYNGDPGNPINGRISGLFFAGTKEKKTGFLPRYSPFGDWRFVLPVERLVSCDMNNQYMYFCDFYCHSSLHYVTVVLTKPDSPADDFCKENCLKLDPNNPFFRVDLSGQFYMNMQLRVELFYTEAVNVRFELQNDPIRCRLGPTNIYGRGRSKVLGIKKNPNCNVCNLYKVKRKRRDSVDINANKKRKVDTMSKVKLVCTISTADGICKKRKVEERVLLNAPSSTMNVRDKIVGLNKEFAIKKKVEKDVNVDNSAKRKLENVEHLETKPPTSTITEKKTATIQKECISIKNTTDNVADNDNKLGQVVDSVPAKTPVPTIKERMATLNKEFVAQYPVTGRYTVKAKRPTLSKVTASLWPSYKDATEVDMAPPSKFGLGGGKPEPTSFEMTVPSNFRFGSQKGITFGNNSKDTTEDEEPSKNGRAEKIKKSIFSVQPDIVTSTLSSSGKEFHTASPEVIRDEVKEYGKPEIFSSASRLPTLNSDRSKSSSEQVDSLYLDESAVFYDQPAVRNRNLIYINCSEEKEEEMPPHNVIVISDDERDLQQC